MKLKSLAMALALTLAIPQQATATESRPQMPWDPTPWWNVRPKGTTPDGLKKMVVYMANGYFDASDTDYELPFGMIVLPQAPGMLIGDGFHKNIMCRSEEETQQHMFEAIQYLAETFGLDPVDYAASSSPEDLENARLILAPYMVDPRLAFKVYSASGDRISDKGTYMRDGGWLAQVIDPNGYTMSNGRTIPPGSTFRYGDYNMRIGRKGENSWYEEGECDKTFKTLKLKFATREPMVQNPLDPAKILVRDIVSYIDEDGNTVIGDGRGSTRPVLTEDGKFSLQTRSMITFPPATAPE